MPTAKRPDFGRLDHCACHDISAAEIEQAVADGATSVVAVFRCFGRRLDCGDCVPAIRRVIAAQTEAQQRRGTHHEL